MKTREDILKELETAEHKLEWLYEYGKYMTEDYIPTKNPEEDKSIRLTKVWINGLKHQLNLLNNKTKKVYPTWIKR